MFQIAPNQFFPINKATDTNDFHYIIGLYSVVNEYIKRQLSVGKRIDSVINEYVKTC